jgi:lysylphosphatidylglycerol synthetase-like protein (DUF2156 family)
VIALWFFVLGAFYPALAFAIVAFVRHWRHQESKSVIGLIWGILLRFVGILFAFGIVGGIVAVISGHEITSQDFEQNTVFMLEITPQDFERNAVFMLVGFFASIALWIFAYLRGRRERLRDRLNHQDVARQNR